MFNKIFYIVAVFSLLLLGQRAESGGSTSEGGGDRPIGARAMELAMSQGCELGPVVYRMEEKAGSNRPVLERVQYICVDGVYRRNGYVPKYPSRCIEGENRMIGEREPYGNHDREVKVRYTCRGGVLRRNP